MNQAIFNGFNGSMFTCLGDGELHLVQCPPTAPSIGRFPLAWTHDWQSWLHRGLRYGLIWLNHWLSVFFHSCITDTAWSSWSMTHGTLMGESWRKHDDSRPLSRWQIWPTKRCEWVSRRYTFFFPEKKALTCFPNPNVRPRPHSGSFPEVAKTLAIRGSYGSEF